VEVFLVILVLNDRLVEEVLSSVPVPYLKQLLFLRIDWWRRC
jgi:hypothetical protein